MAHHEYPVEEKHMLDHPQKYKRNTSSENFSKCGNLDEQVLNEVINVMSQQRVITKIHSNF